MAGDGTSKPKVKNIQNRCLFGQKAKQIDEKPFAVVDIETGIPTDENPLGGTLVIAEMRRSDRPDRVWYAYNDREFADLILSDEFDKLPIYAHNGSGYDFLYFYRWLLGHPEMYENLTAELCMRGDGRVIEMTIKYQKRKIKLRDTYTLLSIGLFDLSRALAPDYAKKERPWLLPDGTFNYFNPCNPDDMEYLHNDVLGLMYSFERFRRVVWDAFGVNVSLTSAGTAIRAWRATIPKEKKYWRPVPRVEEFIRESYAGGLVFLTTTNKVPDVVGVDVNAMYAAAMSRGVPVGSPVEVSGWVDGFPGFYECTVTVPDDERYTFIPYRGPKGTQWLRGTFKTIIPSCTIEYAREMGYTIDVGRGYIFDTVECIFDTFIARCQELELQDKTGPLGMAAKLMRNSLYGRFAMKSEGERIVYTDMETDLAPYIPQGSDVPIANLYTEPTIIDEPYQQIHWASWITATARIILNRIARGTGAIYGDTDSAKFPAANLQPAIDAGVFEIGKTYGMVKVEDDAVWFQPVAPKNYRMLPRGKDKTKGKAKGIPRSVKTEADHERSTTGQKVTVSYWSMKSFKTLTATGGQALGTTRIRSYGTIENSSSWRRYPDGSVLARHAQDEYPDMKVPSYIVLPAHELTG